MGVLSELEKLQKCAYHLDHGTNTANSNEGQRAPCLEDEIELPAFNSEDDNASRGATVSMLDMDVKFMDEENLALAYVCDSEEEIVSNDEKKSLTTTGRSTCLSSKERIFIKDGQTKAKPKLLFRFQSQKEDFPLVVSGKCETKRPQTDPQQIEELEGGTNRGFQRSTAKASEIFDGEVEPLNKNAALLETSKYRDCDAKSVAGFLANLQESSEHLPESSKQPSRLRRRRKKLPFRRNISPPSSEIIDDEDDLMDGRSLADDEGDFCDPKPIIQQKTMADLFHDALGAVAPINVLSEVNTHTLGVGLFDKLQHVMLNEKGKDADFLKRSTVDDHSKDGKITIDVRILSRSLEAKHNVCCCAIIQYKGSSQLVNALDTARQLGERNLTVIFSSRICGDVEFEVGNLIRIQPPWKEVRVRGQKDIILSAYFSQIGV